ncbi:hypothetical protein [Sphingobacterium puteale]|uniref:hypothetical protein n=1 Tax=Sphingobacterium puteale TaxID=2420510 RepID=UPI0011C49BC3|nr:hypothetical protein [Sphingobacterium puteale]
MKTIILLEMLLSVMLSCKDKKLVKDLKAKNNFIDSLRFILDDCKAQAHIMADIMEQERIEAAMKKATD